MTRTEMKALLKNALGSLAEEEALSSPDGTLGGLDGFDLAIDTMLRELGFSLPLDGEPEIRWALERARRHCLERLLTGALFSTDVRLFGSISVSAAQLTEHLRDEVERLDKAFRQAMNAGDIGISPSVPSVSPVRYGGQK